METFSYIAGSASIISLLIAIITLTKVIKIENNIIDKSRTKSKQNLKSKNISDSSIRQVGRDSYE